MNPVLKTFEFGNHTVSMETGVIARQATGSVMVNMDGTVVLVTVVGMKEAKEGQNFFPLTVNYIEKMYAAGRIPGGFFKREGRPSEGETLIARLIDRPIRPLFPKGFLNEVQVICQVMSINPEVNPDIPAMIGTSAALTISGIPFNGPIGASRVGMIDGEFVLNPTKTQMEQSKLDLVVAGTESSVLMVESEAYELSEQQMLDAVMFGHKGMQIVIKACQELAKEAGKPRWDWQPEAVNVELTDAVKAQFQSEITEKYQIKEKQSRYEGLSELRTRIKEQFATDDVSEDEVGSVVSALESEIVRHRILDGELRIDGRNTETVRPITVQTSVLPRTHGSAFFTRGETQAIVVATLGTGRDAQIIDSITGEHKDNFMLHYNFPPFCVGETGMVGSPKRREIGHGRLAKRAIVPVLPEDGEFPYVMRVVSEITESNGSSSMASVCGTSLALMDAGVPLKAPVAGIAMGLIKEGERFAVLTDILGDEDHLGDMDFKVAGSANGVTALQMDIKIDGITKEIMEVALEQAKRGRMGILEIMNANLGNVRTDLSEFAPRVQTLKVHPDKIKDVIGKGGATIKGLTEETGASIEINDDGAINIVAADQETCDDVVARIELITAEVEVDKIYDGTVVKVVDFGAFVNVLPGKDGLVHISQISNDRIQNVADHLEVGQQVRVKCIGIDRQGRTKLSMKEVDAPSGDAEQGEPQVEQAQAQEVQDSE